MTENWNKKTALICVFFQLFTIFSGVFMPFYSLASAVVEQKYSARYILKKGESITTASKKINIKVDDLKKLNQHKNFYKPLELLGEGDEILIPNNYLDEDSSLSEKITPTDSVVTTANAAKKSANILSGSNSSNLAKQQFKGVVTGELNNQTQQWLANKGTAKIAEFATTKDNVLADGIDENEVNVKITDEYSNPLANQTVALEIDYNAIIVSNVFTGVDGTATTRVKSAVGGIHSVKAMLGAKCETTEMSFIQNNVVISLTSDGEVKVADGVQNHEVIATLRDRNSLIPGVIAEFVVTNGASITNSILPSDTNGQIKILVTNEKSGIVSVAGSVGDKSSTIEVQFVPEIATITLSVDKDKVRKGESILLTVVAFNSKGEASGSNIPVTLKGIRAVNRQNNSTTVSSLINGNSESIVMTDYNGRITANLIDDSSLGLKTIIQDSVDTELGPKSDQKDTNFTVITSPDTSEASYYGHMTDEVSVNGVTYLRPLLKRENPSAVGEYAENGESWPAHLQENVAAECGGLNKVPTRVQLEGIVNTIGKIG